LPFLSWFVLIKLMTWRLGWGGPLDGRRRSVATPAWRAAGDAARRDAEAKRIYDGLAFTHRKEFARWVAEAKKDETRDRRVVQTLEMLRAGRTRS
jgi:hypothetical protein